MYKTALVRHVARATGLPQRVVTQVLTASLTTVQEQLVAGEAITLPGFGTFSARPRRAGQIRSVRTGRQVAIPARRVAHFRVGAVLKRAVAKPRRQRRLFGLG